MILLFPEYPYSCVTGRTALCQANNISLLYTSWPEPVKIDQPAAEQAVLTSGPQARDSTAKL